jgi:hypothetical protein
MGPISYTETSVDNYQFNLCIVPQERKTHLHRGKKWIRTFFNLTSKFWDLEFIPWLTRSTASSAPTYGQAEAFCCRRWGFYSKRVGKGYVGVSAVAVILPLLHTQILFMYHRRWIILAVDSIVKYDTPSSLSIPFLYMFVPRIVSLRITMLCSVLQHRSLPRYVT